MGEAYSMQSHSLKVWRVLPLECQSESNLLLESRQHRENSVCSLEVQLQEQRLTDLAITFESIFQLCSVASMFFPQHGNRCVQDEEEAEVPHTFWLAPRAYNGNVSNPGLLP